MTEPNGTMASAADIEQDALLSEAAQWAIELSSVEISPRRIDEWRQWIAASDAHRAAFDRIQAAFAAVDGGSGEDMPWPTDAETANDAYDGSVSISAWRGRGATQRGLRAAVLLEGVRRRGRWIAVGLAASVVFALAAPTALQLLRSLQPEPAVTIVETRAGENRDVTLADGSVVSIGARSVLWATLSRTSRDITLERGEAFFHVAKDSARPFIVRAGDTRVAAVGTAFNVRRAGKRIVVAVAEGVVKVDAQGAQAHAVSSAPRTARLSVGEQLSINGVDGVLDLQIVATDDIAAWREGVLQFRDEPLQSIIADVARYSAARDIVIADAATANLRVTGRVFTNDVDSWIESLAAALPVRAVHMPDGVVRLESSARN